MYRLIEDNITGPCTGRVLWGLGLETHLVLIYRSEESKALCLSLIEQANKEEEAEKAEKDESEKRS